MNYIPNISAKRLITDRQVKSIPEVALLWFTGQHFSYLHSFIHTGQELMLQGRVPEMRFTILPFKPGELENYDSKYFINHCNGIIAPPVDIDDFNYLDNLELSIPAVMLFGKSKKNSFVIMDNIKAGKLAADIFSEHGIGRAVFLCEKSIDYNFSASERRDSFLMNCSNNGIASEVVKVPPGVTNEYGDPEIQISDYIGEWAAEKILNPQHDGIPQAVFAQNDLIALSLVRALKIRNIKIPEDIKVIAYGSNVFAEMNSPRITTINHNYHEFAGEAIRAMAELFSNPLIEPIKKVIDTTVTFRDTCPRL